MDNKLYDIIIIGGGCAGMTAAIYARRAAKSVLLLEGETFGGQISYSPGVENYPGFMNISGPDFSDHLMEQVNNLGADVELESVLSVTDNGETKLVKTDYAEHECKALIIASGLKHRKSGIENEEKLIGRGVSYCAVCDGAFYKGKDVAVYGGGNTAVQDAIFLCDICNKVSIIHRRDSFRAEAHLVEKLKTKKNIEFVLDSTITNIVGEKSLESIVATNKITGEEKQINVSGLFVAIGQMPQNNIFKSIVTLDDAGFIKSGEDCRTSADWIFAAGDCRTKELRQLTTATADGAVAATNACKYIDSL